jgi:DNA-binding helix-hairpin-helix protein with protein kinase domain
MYYVIVPQEVCERRKVFTRNQRTPDGRVVLTLRDLNLTRFSYGPVEIVNKADLQAVMAAGQEAGSNNQTENGEE